MKTLRKHLKLIALFLAVTFLLQSCKVYTYKAATLDEAVNYNYNKEVKIKSNNKETYKFDKIEEIDGVHYGIALKKSKTAKKLADQIIYEDEFKYVKILLKEHQLSEVYVKTHDKALSIVLSIGIPLVIVGVIRSVVGDNLYRFLLN